MSIAVKTTNICLKQLFEQPVDIKFLFEKWQAGLFRRTHINLFSIPILGRWQDGFISGRMTNAFVKMKSC